MSIVRLDYSSVNWKELLFYSESSPSGLVWKERTSRSLRFSGKTAGTLSKYKDGSPHMWRINFNYKSWVAHRIVLILNDQIPSIEDVVDHLDGNPSNNILSNLIICSQSENCRNKKFNKESNTGVLGCSIADNGHGRYYITSHVSLGYRSIYKHFSVDDLGYKNALNEAVKWRENTLKLVQEENVFFSTRHGYNSKSMV